jgi:VWFA-related protein
VGRVVRERFSARLGAGSSLVRLSTARGRIELAPLGDGEPVAATTTATQAAAPTPRGGNDVIVSGSRSDPDNSRRVSSVEPAGATAKTPHLQDAQPPAPTAARRPPAIVGSQGGPPPSRPAGTPAPPIGVDPDEPITVDTHVVTLNLSIVDRQSGRGLTGLMRDDFRVAEDGVEQQITNFEAANAPFDLLLLLDLSGSTAKVTEVIRASALRFVESVRPSDRVGVIAFAGSPQVVSNLTGDLRQLRSRIAGMAAPAGDTKLYDAVAYAIAHVERNSPRERRRAVILMSDGLDSVLPNVQGEGSALSYDDVRSRVQEFDGLFYSVWTDTSYEALSPLDVQPETFDLVYERMEELSKVGGGLFYEVERLEDLAGAYERVVQDLGTVYSVSYIPVNKTRDGRWRAVRVRLPRRPEAVARGRSGYVAK